MFEGLKGRATGNTNPLQMQLSVDGSAEYG